MSDALHTLDFGGTQRRYIVHVPPAYNAARPWPLVLSLHGSNSNGQIQLEFTAMNETADREGFIVVYPFGTGARERMLFWSAGNCCGYAHDHMIDDVGFIHALVDELNRQLSIDPAAVFATGMSNGAMMVYRLASEMADVFAAIAPVAGTMGTASCQPSRPVSVIQFHGTNDEFVPVEGGVGKRSVTGTKHYSVEHSIHAWVQANACPAMPAVTTLANHIDDGTTTEVQVYGPGRDRSEVVLYLIHGAGHIWPGRPPRPHYLGKTTYNVSANEVIWEFFKRHKRH
jgi:polyhydroxybutyrate depolymerase